MAAHQAPPSLGFSRQEHWSGLPFPSIHRQVLNSFSYLVFLFVCLLSVNFCSEHLVFVAKVPMCRGSILTPLERFLRTIWEAPPGLKSLENHQIKHNAQLLGCSFFFFFSWHYERNDYQREHISVDMVMETIVQRFDVPYEEGPLLSLRWHTQMNRMVSVLSRDYSL